MGSFRFDDLDFGQMDEELDLDEVVERYFAPGIKNREKKKGNQKRVRDEQGWD